jgi:hypothetical protein
MLRSVLVVSLFLLLTPGAFAQVSQVSPVTGMVDLGVPLQQARDIIINAINQVSPVVFTIAAITFGIGLTMKLLGKVTH